MEFDIIVIGAGHAGVEAAQIASKLNKKVALVSFSKDDIASLPCNVSIGGSAKGILVKELFALGAIMPIASDNTQLQTKILNTSKGPAVQALRSQIDKIEYPKWISKYIEKQTNIIFIEGEANKIIVDNENNSIKGIIIDGKEYICKKLIICTGTFLDSKIIIGEDIQPFGPDNKKTCTKLSKQLKDIGHKIIRLKTGTPPRIEKSSIDYDLQQPEPGFNEEIYFSEKKFVTKPYENEMAWVAYTNKKTHEIINKNIKKSYLFNDEIIGKGPRYCPSIEDKVKRFNTKDRHQIFLELESKKMNTIYLAGLSSSMPRSVQDDIVRSMKGFENAVFIKYAYAIEYDAIDPRDLYQTLESKKIKSLYFAGQINGTSGYEEAAAQGLLASLNACRSIDKQDEVRFTRNESYIGVMIDDITSNGIIDPYRLLTSRAEYRLLLRSDNAIKRLYEKSYKWNLITKERYLELKERFKNVEEFKKFTSTYKLSKQKEFKEYLEINNIVLRQEGIRLNEFIKRPDVKINDFNKFIPYDVLKKFNLINDDINMALIEIKFDGYIKRQEKEVQNYLKNYRKEIPIDINYSKIQNLASEAIEKLSMYKPKNIHEASRISGINPSDIMSLVQYINKYDK